MLKQLLETAEELQKANGTPPPMCLSDDNVRRATNKLVENTRELSVVLSRIVYDGQMLSILPILKHYRTLGDSARFHQIARDHVAQALGKQPHEFEDERCTECNEIESVCTCYL